MSRADFLREMGLSAEDLKGPPEESTGPRRPAVTREPMSAERNVPPRHSTSQKPDAGTEKNGSRAAFLRSLGIDNADEAQQERAKRNATGSQEMPREPERVRPKFTSRSMHEDSDHDEERAPPPSMAAPDVTLGARSAQHKAPATPALDAELRTLSDAASAEEVKNMGNKYFQAGEYRKAVRLYTKAIELDGGNAALYSNRSAAYLLGGKQMGIDTRSMALRDADKAIKLKPTWFKGFSRRGDALFKLERYQEAAEAYESALELDSGNTSIIHSLNEVRPFLKTKPDVAAWRAPGTGDLHSSVASLGGTKSTSKSAFELLDEFHSERQRTTPQLGRGGVDYKEAQLNRFRNRQSTDSGTIDSQEASVPRQAPSSGQTQGAVPSEFSSDAARDYQNALLESYRKKKAQAQR